VATCNVTYSEGVVRRAVRTFFWRRFKTPLGALYLVPFLFYSVPLASRIRLMARIGLLAPWDFSSF